MGSTRRGFLGALAGLPVLVPLVKTGPAEPPVGLAPPTSRHFLDGFGKAEPGPLNECMRVALERHEARVRAQAQRLAQEAVSRFYEGLQWEGLI